MKYKGIQHLRPLAALLGLRHGLKFCVSGSRLNQSSTLPAVAADNTPVIDGLSTLTDGKTCEFYADRIPHIALPDRPIAAGLYS